MKNKIQSIVMQAINDLNATLEIPVIASADKEIHLYGPSGGLDSISFVTLIVSIEEKLESEENISLLLANDKAFSQKNNPFSTMNSLVAYILDLVNQETCYA